MKNLSLISMLVLYVIAGIYHFVSPQTYLGIMPAWLPYPAALVAMSGAFEILFGLLLIFKVTRQFAAWGIIVLLMAVFPANINMALQFYRQNNAFLWLAVLRLPIQALLIWWAYSFTRKNAL